MPMPWPRLFGICSRIPNGAAAWARQAGTASWLNSLPTKSCEKPCESTTVSTVPVRQPSAPGAAVQPVKVLILTASYVPVLGGLQTAVHSLARHLREVGHDVRVVANRYPRALPNADTIDGVPVRRWLFLRPSWAQVRRRRPDLLLASLYYYPSVLRRLSGMVQALRPDVLN